MELGDAAPQALARKWRPRGFGEVVGQAAAVDTLRRALASGRLHHAYMFIGTRGVGKTTLARILAKAFNCERPAEGEACGQCDACRQIDAGSHPDLYEMDAASTTQVDSMREVLDSTSYAPASGRHKVYIIDEVHMLSKASFNAMLKTLEEPPPHVKFILATTDPQQVPATVHSRCLKFSLRRLGRDAIAAHLASILRQEKIEYEEEALQLVASQADGSVRDALSIVEEVVAGGVAATAERARTLLGLAAASAAPSLFEALRARDGARALALADDLHAQGSDLDQVLAGLVELIHRDQLAAILPAQREAGQAAPLDPTDAQLLYDIACRGRMQLQGGVDAKIAFDMTLMRIVTLLGTRPQPAPVAAAARPAAAPRPAAPAPSPESASAPPPASQPPPAPPPAAGPAGPPADAETWQALSARVDRRAHALAQQCVFVGFADGTLRLAATDAALLSQQDHLLRSLGKLTAGAIAKLEFDDGQQDEAAAQPTPAQVQDREDQAHEKKVLDEFETSDEMRKLRDIFPGSTAKVVKESD